MHVLDLIYYLFQFFFLSPQDLLWALESVLQWTPPLKRSRKHIAHSPHARITERTAEQLPTNLGISSFSSAFPGSAQPAGRLASPWLAGEAMLEHQSPWLSWPWEGQGPLGRRDGHGFSSVPNVTHPSWRVQTLPCCSYLPLPELPRFNSANTQHILWILAKISWSCTAIYDTDIFWFFFFSVFLSTHWNTIFTPGQYCNLLTMKLCHIHT